LGFGDNTRPKTAGDNANTNTGNSVYMKLKPAGDDVIRILNKTEEVPFYWRYFMPVNVGGSRQSRGIVVGRNGPIAKRMAEIGEGNRGFYKPGKRMLLNVLDREDSTVKVLDFGADLLNQFTTYHKRVRSNKTFEPLNIWDVDLRIISTPGKEPKDVKRQVMPDMDQEPLAPDLAALPIYDLTQLCRIMPDEMQERLLADEDLLEILRELNWERPVPTLPQD
jgi:hypothetical protein